MHAQTRDVRTHTDSAIWSSLAPKIITAELDFDAMAAIRQKMPIQIHRRADLFELSVKPNSP